MSDLRMVTRAELAFHKGSLGPGLYTGELDVLVRLPTISTPSSPERKIEMPIGAPEFAIGDRAKAYLLLLLFW